MVGLAAAGLMVVLTAGLISIFVPSLAVVYGLPPAGTVVTFGLPLARMTAQGAPAAGIGQLLIAAVLAPGEPEGLVSADGFRGLRVARWCAVLEGAAAIVVALLTVVENSGLATSRLLGSLPALLAALPQIAPATGWLITGVLAILVAAGAEWTLTWRGAVGLLLAALGAPLPAMLTAATDAQRSHDIAGDALALHVLAALLWLGSASAVAVHLARGGRPSPVVLRRHGALASGALVVVGVSGIISSAYAVSAADLIGSGFGWLIVASGALLVALLPVGRRLRMAAGGSRGTRTRIAGLITAELSLLAVAAALGTTLTRVAPPAQLGYVASGAVYLIGYDLPPTFGLIDLVWRWRIDLVFGPLAVGAAVVYMCGLRRLGKAGRGWSHWHATSWMGGCAMLLAATSSGIGLYAPAMFSVHMVQHMLLATVIPALLVLGHPVTLAGRALAPRTAQRVAALVKGPVAVFLSHPVVAWVAVGVTLFGLYPTGLYESILQEHWAHLAMETAFLTSGVLLFRSILGWQLGRRALPPIGELVMIFAVMTLHAVFAAWLLSRPTPIAEQFYASLRAPFVPDLLADQRRGAVASWILGEFPIILAVLSLVVRWTRDDVINEGDPWRVNSLEDTSTRISAPK